MIKRYVWKRALVYYAPLAAAGVLFCTIVLAFFVPLIAAVFPIYNGAAASEGMRPLWRVALFTLTQAFFSALGASAIGLCAAFFCACRTFPGRTLLLSLSAVPLSIPPVVISLAFILFFGKNGVLNTLLLSISNGAVSTGTFLYSFGGLLLVHSFYNFPIAMRAVSDAWEKLPEETEQAACLLGASPVRVFRTVIFPALKAPLCASFLIIFLYCFFSFVIILLLGGLGTTTLEVELYQTIRTNVHAGSAALLAAVETGIAVTFVSLYAYVRKTAPDHTVNTHYNRQKVPIRSRKERMYFAVLIAVICFFLLFPLFDLVRYSLSSPQAQYTLTVQPWCRLLKRPAFWHAVYQTIQTGIGTAVISVTSALFFAFAAFQQKGAWYKVLPLLPFSVSSIVLGSGWLRLESTPSVFLLIIVQSSLAWPFAWMQIEISLAKIPRSALDAAVLLSASRTDAFFRATLPLCKTGIFSALCCVFAISAADASLPLVLHILDFENLALMLFRYAGSYRFTESACIAVILAVLTGFFFFVQEKIRYRA